MALAFTVQFDVRTTGNDANGGGFDAVSGVPGTDYSQQDAAQFTYSDLVIGSTNTQLTSVAFPFTAAAVGNLLNVTGGTGFTTGRYQVMSVAGAVATMDRAVGTAASTGGAGKMGGSLANFGAITLNTLNVNANFQTVIWLKAGTYAYTTQQMVEGNGAGTGGVNIIGYQTTHGDNAARPLITTSTNGVNPVATNGGAGVMFFQNVSFSHTAVTRADGIRAGYSGNTLILDNCIVDGFTKGINGDNGSSTYIFAAIVIRNTEIKNCSVAGIINQGASVYCEGSYLHNNSGYAIGLNGSGSVYVRRSIIANNTGAGIDNSASGTSTVWLRESTVAFNGGGGVKCAAYTNNTTSAFYESSIIYGNTGYGVSYTSTNLVTGIIGGYNAWGSNSTGDTSNYTKFSTDISLTANPFVASGSGNFALNGTAGGGAACKGTGFPGAFPGGTSTGSPDIGAVQSAAGGGGGAGGAGGAHTFLG